MSEEVKKEEKVEIDIPKEVVKEEAVVKEEDTQEVSEPKAKAGPKPDADTEAKEEKEEAKEEEKEEADNAEEQLGFSPFVKEDDRFDIKVCCYNDDELGLLVKGVDTEFDEEKEDTQEIKFTFKHVSQGDFNVISAQSGSFINDDDAPEHVNLNKLEFARFLVLVREWSLPEKLSNENIVDLNPKITKSVIYQLREEISLDGIF